MKVVICWSHIAGYTTACWRKLAAQNGIELSVIAFHSSDAFIGFDQSLVEGLDHRLLGGAEQKDARLIRDWVIARKPDIVVIPGWFETQYARLVLEPQLAAAKFIMTMDTPYRGTLRQHLGKYKIAWQVKRLSGVVVPGERAFRLARVLGIPEQKILRGMNGFDDAPLKPIFTQRFAAESSGAASAWPRRFLFVGRYVDDKAIDVLVDAYARYRKLVADPWPLTCCGRGPLQNLLKAEGIEDRGFVQPSDIPAVLLEHGVYVLSSRYEPWGVAMAEAMASGIPVIATEACGAIVELVRSEFNGLIVPTDDAAALAAAMRRMHDNVAQLSSWGKNARPAAAAFSADLWATRWRGLFEKVLGG